MKSQEVSEGDGLPVLLKHLPDGKMFEIVQFLQTDVNDLRQALGERPVFDTIDFIAGTEAVTAPYEQGKLLIVEFATPQGSVDTDNRVNQLLAESGTNPPFVYRRIGNYNAFVFDARTKRRRMLCLTRLNTKKWYSGSEQIHLY
jgi:hypothetical protein